MSGEVRVWELRSGVRLGFTDLRAPLSCMAVSQGTIYCGSGRGTLHGIDRDDLTSTQSVKLASGIVSLALLPQPTGLRAMFSRPAPRSSSSAGPYIVAGLGNGSFVILQGLLPLHSYSMPVSHPACVSVVPTGPEGFIAAASPDTLFVWQGPLPRGPEDDGPTKADGTSPTKAEGAPALRVLVSSEMREDGRDTRHVDTEPCDVALTVMCEGLMGRQTVVTACNHDLCLRWWDLGVGGRGGSCTHMTEAFDLSSRTFGGGEVRIGTLALAHAKGVLLSAHLDGTLVVWHVGQRSRVGVYSSLPLLEAVAMAPSTLGILASFEKHVIYSSEVRGEDEEDEGQGEGREARSRSGTGGSKGKPPGPFVKPRRRKTFPQKGGQNHHGHH